MARPQREGLDYFPIVTTFDDKIDLIIAEFGPEGLGIIIGLFQKIYSNGYYMNWDEDTLMLFATKHINTDITRVNAVLMRSLDRNIFNKELYDKYNILTSSGIQKQFLKICKDCRRKSVQFIKDYCLIKQTDKLYGVITELISINVEETLINDVESTQREREREREIESKEKEKEQKAETPSPLSQNKKVVELCTYYSEIKPGQSILEEIPVLEDFIKKFGYEWTKEALKMCVDKKGQFIEPWIRKVLENWKIEGHTAQASEDNGKIKIGTRVYDADRLEKRLLGRNDEDSGE